MKRFFFLPMIVAVLVIATGCGGGPGTPAAKPGGPDPANTTGAAVRSNLSAEDLIHLFECSDASCVQLFMKNYAHEFIYGKKGEFASYNRSSIADSTGAPVVIPSATLYFSTDPGADWRMAQTLHSKELSDELLNEFAARKFTLVDSFFYHATKAICYKYTSSDYPEKRLYFSKTYSPWGSKGLYVRSGWLSYVFEIKTGK